MFEMVAQRVFDNFCRFRCRQFVFCLALKFRLAHKYGYQSRGCAHHIFAGDDAGFFIINALAIGLQPFGEGGAHALFVGAAFGGRHGVAIAGIHAVCIADTGSDPCDGPFARAVPAFFLHFTGKNLRCDRGASADLFFEIILQAIGEFQHILKRAFIFIFNKRRVAFPANFNAAKQISLGFCHGVKPRRIKLNFTENLSVRHKSNGCAALVFRFPDLLHRPLAQALREGLLKLLLLARHLNQQVR